MHLICTKCGKPKENNNRSLCLICYTETLEPYMQQQIKNSDKYRALAKLQSDCPTLNDLLQHRLYNFEMFHAPRTFESKEDEYTFAFNLLFDNYKKAVMIERFKAQHHSKP